jgi:demethylmenaquinone methyltransferase/2-methoxy-6-polyprenyl-1,4-benzoquinol methylase
MTDGIQKVFSEVPATYELVNHVLTMGLDIQWRRRIARLAVSLASGKSSRLLDICTGTGETAAYLGRWGNGAGVVAADFTPQMLRKGASKNGTQEILFTLADARALPFPDNSFDVITISFATRNLNTSKENMINCFREFRRVLKPGGHFINLETSQPPSVLVRKGFRSYVRLLVRPVGARISGSRTGYIYLSNTIPRFYGPDELASILLDAGFSSATYKRMFLGIAAVHQATR